MNRTVATIDALGNRSTVVSDVVGRPAAQIDPLGNRTTTVYNAAGDPIATINPLGNRWTTLYDGAGRQKVTIDPLGRRTTVGYDAASRQVFTQSPVNRVTTVYDAANRVVSSVGASCGRSTTVYNAANQTVASVAPLLNRTTTIYDAAGRAAAVQNARGFRSTTVFNNASEGIAAIDPLGRRTTTLLDGGGRTRASVNGLGYRTSFAYDAASNQVSVTNPRGYRSTVLYDALDRGHVSIDPLLYRTTTVFDAAGRTRRTVDAVGAITTPVYDAASRTVATINPLGNRWTTVYDNASQVRRTLNPIGAIRTSLYDAAGQAVSSINPLAFRTTTIYDAGGRPLAVRDALNNRTTNVYHACGKLVATVNALGFRTTNVFDAASRQISLVDPKGNRTTFGYDSVGNQTFIKDALLNLTTFAYDAANQQSYKHDPRGFRITYSYDAAGALTRKRYADGSRVTFAFDRNGNRTLARDSLGRYSWLYDERDAVRATNVPANERITYAFDAVGNRRHMEVHGSGRTTYSYLPGSKVHFIQCGSARFTWGYDTLGRQTSERAPNSVVTTLSYYANSRIRGMLAINSMSVVTSANTYAYDAVDRPISVLEAPNARTTWAFDAIGRLSSEHRSSPAPSLGYRLTHHYDEANNRTSEIGSTGDRTTFSYDRGRLTTRATAQGTSTFSYDPAGNLVLVREPSARGTYVWDMSGRLRHFSQANVSKYTMLYGPTQALPFSLRTPSQITTCLFDEQRPILQVTGVQTRQSVYAREMGTAPIAYLTPNIQTRSPDGFGSAISVVDASGVVEARNTFSLFGQQIDASPTSFYGYGAFGRAGFTLPSSDIVLFQGMPYSTSIGRMLVNKPSSLTCCAPTDLDEPPKDEEKIARGCCGPDILKSLQNALWKVRFFWDKVPVRVKGDYCAKFNRWSSFDIQELLNIATWEKGNCPTGDNKNCCRECVTVGGNKYDRFEVNYILWGMINCYCGWHCGIAKSITNINKVGKGILYSTGINSKRTCEKTWQFGKGVYDWIDVGYNMAGCSTETEWEGLVRVPKGSDTDPDTLPKILPPADREGRYVNCDPCKETGDGPCIGTAGFLTPKIFGIQYVCIYNAKTKTYDCKWVDVNTNEPPYYLW